MSDKPSPEEAASGQKRLDTQADNRARTLSEPSRAAATGVVIYAKNADRVAEFYRQTLSLTVEESAADFIVLSGSGVEVSVVRMPDAIAATVTIATPPEVRESTPVKASFLVSDFEAVRQAARATGGSLGPSTVAWSWRGSLHLDGCDPEGNVVQFRRRGD